MSVGLAAPTAQLTDMTEGICTGGPGSTGMVCPLARCMTRGREPVGDPICLLDGGACVMTEVGEGRVG